MTDGDAADLVEVLGPGVLRLGLALRDERDEVVLAHRLLERLDRALAADEQRHDEVREQDEVPQRNQRQHLGDARGSRRAVTCCGASFRWCRAIIPFAPMHFMVHVLVPAPAPHLRRFESSRWPSTAAAVLAAQPSPGAARAAFSGACAAGGVIERIRGQHNAERVERGLLAARTARSHLARHKFERRSDRGRVPLRREGSVPREPLEYLQARVELFMPSGSLIYQKTFVDSLEKPGIGRLRVRAHDRRYRPGARRLSRRVLGARLGGRRDDRDGRPASLLMYDPQARPPRGFSRRARERAAAVRRPRPVRVRPRSVRRARDDVTQSPTGCSQTRRRASASASHR